HKSRNRGHAHRFPKRPVLCAPLRRGGRAHCRSVLHPHLLSDEYGRDRLSPDFYEESETDPGAEELPARIFVALFDYDPLTMSPNPDAAEEELPFKEGQIIKVRAGRPRGEGSG
ncbi:RIMS-binding protein 2, partial [Saguinus oedipus]